MILNVFTLSCTTAPRKTDDLNPLCEIECTQEITAPGDQPVNELLRRCDKALTDCKRANKDKQSVIDEQDKLIVETSHQLEECKKSRDSLWSKPLFTIILGVVATLLTLLLSGHTK